MTQLASSARTLEKISSAVEARLAERMRKLPFEHLLASLNKKKRRPHDFKAMLRRPGFNVIAEIKFRSPSQGSITSKQEPALIARQYLEAGAGALSILTEEDYFGGSLTYLKTVRDAFPNALLLQKDFIIAEYQVYEAFLYGADAILIILSLVSPENALKFLDLARSLGLSALVEVHDENEVQIAHTIGADLIGINNRNLNSLKISFDVTHKLKPLCPASALIVSESGIESHTQLTELTAIGCHGFLVGTSLMGSGAPGEALRKLLGKVKP